MSIMNWLLSLALVLAASSPAWAVPCKAVNGCTGAENTGTTAGMVLVSQGDKTFDEKAISGNCTATAAGVWECGPDVHATDCTLVACTREGEMCYEQDDDTLFCCKSSVYTACGGAGTDTNAATICADDLVLLGQDTPTCIDPATQAELDTHEGNSSAHHAPTVDTNAKTLCADDLVLLGQDATTCVDPALQTELDTHDTSEAAHPSAITDTGPVPDCAAGTYQEGDASCDAPGGDVAGTLDNLQLVADSVGLAELNPCPTGVNQGVRFDNGVGQCLTLGTGNMSGPTVHGDNVLVRTDGVDTSTYQTTACTAADDGTLSCPFIQVVCDETTGKCVADWELNTALPAAAAAGRLGFYAKNQGGDPIGLYHVDSAGTETGYCQEDGDNCPAAGGGDALEVEDGDDVGTFTGIDTTAQLSDQGDINFVVTDGGAGGPDAVTGEIRANAVGAPEIADDSVGTTEIVANGVGADEIATGAVGEPEIATDAVGADEIAAGAVGNAELANDAVTNAKMADDAIGPAEMADGSHGAFAYTAGVAALSDATLADGDDDTTCLDAGVACLFAASASEGGAATTALAFATDPGDCPGGQFANAIAVDGDLTCAVPGITGIDIARTWIVTTDGTDSGPNTACDISNPCATIQHAINVAVDNGAAEPGQEHVIAVRAGTYVEDNIKIWNTDSSSSFYMRSPSKLLIRGDSMQYTNITSTNLAACSNGGVCDAAGFSSECIFDVSGAANLAIEELSMNGFFVAEDEPLLCSAGGANVQLRSVGINTTASQAIRFRGVGNVTSTWERLWTFSGFNGSAQEGALNEIQIGKNATTGMCVGSGVVPFGACDSSRTCSGGNCTNSNQVACTVDADCAFVDCGGACDATTTGGPGAGGFCDENADCTGSTALVPCVKSSCSGFSQDFIIGNDSFLQGDAVNVSMPLVRTCEGGATSLTGTNFAITEGSRELVGTGTLFTTQVAVGDRVTVNGEERTVQRIMSALSLFVGAEWDVTAGTNGSATVSNDGWPCETSGDCDTGGTCTAASASTFNVQIQNSTIQTGNQGGICTHDTTDASQAFPDVPCEVDGDCAASHSCRSYGLRVEKSTVGLRSARFTPNVSSGSAVEADIHIAAVNGGDVIGNMSTFDYAARTTTEGAGASIKSSSDLLTRHIYMGDESATADAYIHFLDPDVTGFGFGMDASANMMAFIQNGVERGYVRPGVTLGVPEVDFLTQTGGRFRFRDSADGKDYLVIDDIADDIVFAPQGIAPVHNNTPSGTLTTCDVDRQGLIQFDNDIGMNCQCYDQSGTYTWCPLDTPNCVGGSATSCGRTKTGETNSVVIEDLAAADDNLPIWSSPNYATRVTRWGCRCNGACTTGAVLQLEDHAGNIIDLSGTPETITCATGSAAITFTAIDTADTHRLLAAGEGLQITVTNGVSPETDTYEIVWEYTID